MVNQLTLAVAGSRKTQGIVEYCSCLPKSQRALVVTYTKTNQEELLHRLSKYAGDQLSVEVLGWYTFLLRHFARPFLPFKHPGKRVLGFNFDGRPALMAKGISRFLDSSGSVYACELGRLAHELISDSKGALIHRLECLYDEILIDEVQDLSSHDWEIIDVLLLSSISIRMVGDIRQSVLSTNPRSTKNKQYAYAEVIEWFRERQIKGLLDIIESSTTWRCHSNIAAFSDTIFDSCWEFPETYSMNEVQTEHDGVFLVPKKYVAEYIARYRPQCLRDSVKSGKEFSFDFMNFKISKGSTFERVLIIPTAGIVNFIQKGEYLKPGPAASFYVAVTRAKQSVAIVIDNPGSSTLPCWQI